MAERIPIRQLLAARALPDKLNENVLLPQSKEFMYLSAYEDEKNIERLVKEGWEVMQGVN